MSDAPLQPRRATDTVEIARVEKLLGDSPAVERLFADRELKEAGAETKGAIALAVRLAAKNACGKLVPRDVELGRVAPRDFTIFSGANEGWQIDLNPAARAALDRHRLDAIRLSITQNDTSASAIAEAEPRKIDVP